MIAQPVGTHLQTPLATLEGITKSFHRGNVANTVLHGVDLRVRRGECVFLAGPSGSGKTTLLSILGGVLSADEGRVCLFGEDLQRLTEPERLAMRRDRIGFVFQRFHLIRGLNAVDNVGIPLVLQGVSWPEARRQAMAMLESVGMAEHAQAHPARLSGGQCQRIALARSVVGQPDLVLADEPTAALDAENGRDVMELLRRLTVQEGKAAVVVTHDPRIFRYADRIVRLDDGRIVAEDRATELVAANQAGGEL